jgi:hypothetical protein
MEHNNDIEPQQNALRPQTYAGLKYYDILTTTMVHNREAMLSGNYQQSAVLLFEYFNATAPAMIERDRDSIRKKLKLTQKMIDAWEGRASNAIRSNTSLTIMVRKLRDDLRDIHFELYMATKNLMMKYGNSDEGELDFTLLSRGG